MLHKASHLLVQSPGLAKAFECGGGKVTRRDNGWPESENNLSAVAESAGESTGGKKRCRDALVQQNAEAIARSGVPPPLSRYN